MSILTDNDINHQVALAIGLTVCMAEDCAGCDTDVTYQDDGSFNLGDEPCVWVSSMDACLRDIQSGMLARGYLLGVTQYGDGTYQFNWQRGEAGKALIRGEPPRSEPMARAFCLAFIASGIRWGTKVVVPASMMYEVASDGRTVWVNNAHGSIARFVVRDGSYEVHKDVAEQIESGTSCLVCTSQGQPVGWSSFLDALGRCYGIDFMPREPPPAGWSQNFSR